MKIKISGTFEGKCSICGKETKVINVGDEETGKVACVCEDHKMQLSDVIDQHGEVNKEYFEQGVKVEKKGTAA